MYWKILVIILMCLNKGHAGPCLSKASVVPYELPSSSPINKSVLTEQAHDGWDESRGRVEIKGSLTAGQTDQQLKKRKREKGWNPRTVRVHGKSKGR